VIRVTHPAIASFSRIALGMAALALPAGLAVGCAGYAQVDGYDADYVDAPPPEVVAAPTYRVNDGYIYVANGRYYHQHSGRWVTYHRLPPAAVRVNVRARARY
jgi:hypothetical protein